MVGLTALCPCADVVAILSDLATQTAGMLAGALVCASAPCSTRFSQVDPASRPGHAAEAATTQ